MCGFAHVLFLLESHYVQSLTKRKVKHVSLRDMTFRAKTCEEQH